MLDPTGARDQAFTTLVLPEVKLLLQAATTLTARPSDAEALVRDTLLRAYRAIDRFDGRYPRAWLLAQMRQADITRNHRRRARRPEESDTGLDRLSPGGPADFPEELVVGETDDEAVRAELGALPERLWQVVGLVDMAGLTYAEAAVVLGTPKTIVKRRLRRARRRMRSRLATEGVPSKRSG
ncbi:RNA polymerase sigma factor [Streptomyces spinosirectus]